MQERHQQVEQGIASLESGIAECERELQSFVSADETQRWTELLAKRRGELEGVDGGVGEFVAGVGRSVVTQFEIYGWPHRVEHALQACNVRR